MPPNLDTLPCDVLEKIMTHLTDDIWRPHSAVDLLAVCSHVCHCSEAREQAEELRVQHLQACALAVRCVDWEERFRRGPVQNIEWVSQTLIVSECSLIARMCRSAHVAHSLRRLVLRDNGITSTGAKQLWPGLLHTPTLEVLNMTQNAIADPDRSSCTRTTTSPSPSGVAAFISMLRPRVLPRLRVLRLAENGLVPASKDDEGNICELYEQLRDALNGGCLPALDNDVFFYVDSPPGIDRTQYDIAHLAHTALFVPRSTYRARE